VAPDCHSRPAREHGKNFKNSYQPSAKDLLPFAVLEALSCTLLSVLFALFAARVATH
jgi:hypothetical protein